MRIIATLALAIAASLTVSCTLCRTSAIREAEELALKGKESAVVTYKVGKLAQLSGLFIWNYHAEAVIRENGKWIPASGLRFRPAGYITLWNTEAYKRAVTHYEKTGEEVVPENGWKDVDWNDIDNCVAE